MSVETSENPASSPSFQPSGCPRCAVKLERPYKYCPNCSYRLRPDLVRHHAAGGAEPVGQSQRILAVGGYLGFVSLLLLLVLTGLRLFGGETMPPEEPLRRIKVAVKSVTFGDGELHEVSGGEVSWGAYRPVDSTGVLRDLLRRMPTLPSDDEDAGQSELEDWLERTRSVLEEQTRALLPDLYRVDDPFRIGVAEITNEQWYAFLHARAKKSGKPAPGDYYPRSWTRSSPDRLVPRLYPAAGSGKPVSDISCVAAIEFCNWAWEEVLGADPDLVVDLPNPMEFARAGRGGSLDNFPWGLSLGDVPVPPDEDAPPNLPNLSGQSLPTRGPAVGYFRGLYAQIGNVAEWIHFQDGCAAAGWSYLNSARRYASGRNEWTSPFSSEAVEEYPVVSDRAEHIGFRIVVRRAPAMPRFLTVTAGPARFVARANPIMPPTMQIYDPATDEYDLQQLAPLSMPTGTFTMPRDIEMAANEITNRQYLAFLVEEAPKLAPERLRSLLPGGFRLRDHPLLGRDIVFRGVIGDGASIPMLFEAGSETRPVQGVTPSQAQAYARWLSGKLGRTVRLPTAVEYVRAGRGDATSPYPWGESVGKPELICDGRADDQDRVRSLYAFLTEQPDVIQGLCGNVLELVEAPLGVVRPVEEPDPTTRDWLLAGGCYEFEAEGCTLDSFLDQQWQEGEVERIVEPDEDGSPPERFIDRIPLASLTGFRVVREAAER